MRRILDGAPEGEHVWIELRDDGTVTLGLHIMANIEAPAQQTRWIDRPSVTIPTEVLTRALEAAAIREPYTSKSGVGVDLRSYRWRFLGRFSGSGRRVLASGPSRTG